MIRAPNCFVDDDGGVTPTSWSDLKVGCDRDIWLIASMLIDTYGSDAVYEAGSRADDSVQRRDSDGAVLWLRIVEAVDELQRIKRVGEVQH